MRLESVTTVTASATMAAQMDQRMVILVKNINCFLIKLNMIGKFFHS